MHRNSTGNVDWRLSIANLPTNMLCGLVLLAGAGGGGGRGRGEWG